MAAIASTHSAMGLLACERAGRSARHAILQRLSAR
jgi:hypothetical protein